MNKSTFTEHEIETAARRHYEEYGVAFRNPTHVLKPWLQLTTDERRRLIEVMREALETLPENRGSYRDG